MHSEEEQVSLVEAQSARLRQLSQRTRLQMIATVVCTFEILNFKVKSFATEVGFLCSRFVTLW